MAFTLNYIPFLGPLIATVFPTLFAIVLAIGIVVDDAIVVVEGAAHYVEMGLSGILVSPEFLFRIERDASPTDPSKTHQIADTELATRLSYFLWSSMPDDELLRVAANVREAFAEQSGG